MQTESCSKNNPNNPDRKNIILLTLIFSATLLFAAGIFILSKNDKKNSSSDKQQITKRSVLSEKDTASSCPATVADVDDNIYNTVQIGTQCWMKKNLKVAKNPSRTIITRYCYNNDTNICNTDGGLYDWNTAMNKSQEEGSQGICPSGWHIPKDSEWYILENSLKDPDQSCDAARNETRDCAAAGTKLKQKGSSGFDATIAGTRDAGGSFGLKDLFASFWSSSAETGTHAWYRDLNSSSPTVGRGTMAKTVSFSIRCLKDNKTL